MKHKIYQVKFLASKSSGEVSGLVYIPDEANMMLVLAHGAGAGMRHTFMEKLALFLAEQRIATFRYNFPYSEKGLKRPDPAPLLLETVRSAINEAKKYAGNLPIFAGGKSMGGRMTSTAASKGYLPEIKGIIFFGFPLHAPGKPSNDRAEHLISVNIPMLFLQGTKDKLADLILLKPVIEKLGSIATLEIFNDADHSFHVPKSAGSNDDEVLILLVNKVVNWAKKLLKK